ncbi:MAG: endonuclease [Lacinutrix sp.]|uniref:endonuclease n=1 Tax=Lacinutrix sp. TaxID=1937692 RepID=UPI0030B2D574
MEADDPVDIYEVNRNNNFETTQGNRNPFIDNPYLATIIWGGDNAANTWNVLSVNENILTTPKIYPTIVSERLYYSNLTIENISIYNTIGQKIDITLNEDYIDVQFLKNGMYFLRSNNYSFKFIKK